LKAGKRSEKGSKAKSRKERERIEKAKNLTSPQTHFVFAPCRRSGIPKKRKALVIGFEAMT
jgi:hypothetical protein